MNKFRVNDIVVINSGKDKGVVDKISKVYPKTKKLLLEKSNFKTKHFKPTQQSEGGIKQVLYPLSWAKISHYDEKKKTKKKVSFVFDNSKTKTRLIN